MNIGFIGLGVIGRPMAGHLIAAGHTLTLSRVKDVSSPGQPVQTIKRRATDVRLGGATLRATLYF